MANTKIQSVPANTLRKYIKENYEDEKTIEWNGRNIVIRRFLPLQQMMEFVDQVAQACFTQDGKQYIPEVRDFITDVEIINRYTNISLPKDVHESYELIYKSGIMGCVKTEIDQMQLSMIIRAISERVNFLVQSNMSYLAKSVNDVVSTVNHLVGQFEAIYQGVTAEDFKKLISGMTKDKLDERKLIHAYFDEKRASEQNAGVNQDGNN